MALRNKPTTPLHVVLPSQINVKKPYRKPLLSTFGTITELTAAGSMGGAEGTAMSAAKMG